MATRIEPTNGIIRVKAGSTANLTLSGAQTIDGVSCVAGDLVLAKDQNTGAEKAIYLVAAEAWTLVDPGPNDGLLIEILQGSTLGDKTYRVTNAITWGSGTPTFEDQTGGSSGGMVTLTGSQTLTNKTISTGTVISASLAFAKETDYAHAVAQTTTAATAGGALAFAAGKSGTTGAGGAASLTGGAGDTTGAGGAASLVGGAGGATSGTGGAASVAGGAGSAGNANGGAVNIDGGAKNGSGADGAINIGVTRGAINIGKAGSLIGVNGVTAAAIPTPAGYGTMQTAGDTTGLYTNTATTGGVGSTQFTFGDLVASLKTNGFIKQ